MSHEKLTPEEERSDQEIRTFIEEFASHYINPESPIKLSIPTQFMTLKISLNCPVHSNNCKAIKEVEIWQSKETTIIKVHRPELGHFEASTFGRRPDAIFYQIYQTEEGRLLGKEAFAHAKELQFI
jgi:hypothetical protein